MSDYCAGEGRLEDTTPAERPDTSTGTGTGGTDTAADGTAAAGDGAGAPEAFAECVLCREPTEYPESRRGITLCPVCEWQEAQRTACSG
ncbi:hypothetical protein [Streptomyces physcomitrii]|uniref:Small CPxCG-related zinc finger protein n=1 Tax=Streptomyces physcomitrii TaxID=2724184 RepID=A0ABX1H8U8_9ACTN|nr:hypothetical protein [Streptomyces physcomitrii]NKI44482.1 hypothetical protein [Streptomyces physcomitrii]